LRVCVIFFPPSLDLAAPITATNDPKPWMVYLHPTQNETVVLCGVVNKPNPLGKQMIRELILTSQKRLIYVDSATLEEKGSIEWKSQNGVEPFVKIVSKLTHARAYICWRIAAAWIAASLSDSALTSQQCA
jgi:hypothetical protein